MITLSKYSTAFRSVHVIACLAFVTVLSWALLSPDPFAVVENGPFKLVADFDDLVLHSGAYFIFATVWIALVVDSKEAWVRTTVLSLIVLHGTGTEILQAFVPGRTCDPFDGLANMAGIAMGSLFVRMAVNATRLRKVRHDAELVSP